MRWKVISASVRGSSHERTGMPNQDAVDYGVNQKSEPTATVLAVSDGHGGGRHFRSQIGATLAVHVTVQTVRNYLTQTPGSNGAAGLSDLSRKIVEAWLAAVGSDLANNPFSDEELTRLLNGEGQANRDSVLANPELAYGATLLMAAATDDRLFYLQLGDGDILAVGADGKTTRPLPEDARLTGNQTTSLCQPEAWKEFRTAEVKSADGLPVLVLLSTDGYINSFRTQEDFLQIGQDYLQILREQGSDSLADELPQILKDATQQGSGDDISLGMMHVEVLPPASAARDLADPGKPAVTKSALIRAFSEERSTQQKKLTELEFSFAGVRKHVVQLRLLVGAVILIAAALLTQQYWLPLIRAKSGSPADPVTPRAGGDRRPGKGGKQPENDPAKDGPVSPAVTPAGIPAPDGGAGKPAAAPADGEEGHFFLALDGGKEISLARGDVISSSVLAPKEKQHDYARVDKLGVLRLVNLSSDKWEVLSPGSTTATPYSPNEVVNLRDGVKIKFTKASSATVIVRN